MEEYVQHLNCFKSGANISSEQSLFKNKWYLISRLKPKLIEASLYVIARHQDKISFMNNLISIKCHKNKWLTVLVKYKDILILCIFSININTFLPLSTKEKKTKHKVLILHKIRFMRLIFLNADKKLFFLSYENNNNNRWLLSWLQ